jgi:hypothetical protein
VRVNRFDDPERDGAAAALSFFARHGARVIFLSKHLLRPRPRPSTIPPDPISAKERQALADRSGQVPGQTASEMVIEDRGEW